MNARIKNRLITSFLVFLHALYKVKESYAIDIERLNYNVISDLRYATFGTSRTWGALLQNRTTEAYPWLLSQNTINYAIRGSDARYPSMCLQSMISNLIFDVIIVEYDRYTGNLDSCIAELIRRLRQRFPKATIILTNIWLLWDIEVVTKDGQVIKYPRWVNYNKYLTPTELINLAERTGATFRFNPVTYESVAISENIAQRFNVKLYSWFNKNEHLSVQWNLFSRLNYFEDFLHWNKVGHSRIAIDIYRIVFESQSQKSNEIGTLTEMDVCSLWIQSGELEYESRFKVPPNVLMKMFDEEKGKFALDLPQSNTSATFEIINEFEKPHNFYLTYMVSHPNRLYPRTELILSASSGSTTTKYFIDPFEDHGYPAHFPVLKGLGALHPGINNLTIRSLEVTEFPFRIIGYSISDVHLDQNNSTSSYSWYF